MSNYKQKTLRPMSLQGVSHVKTSVKVTVKATVSMVKSLDCGSNWRGLLGMLNQAGQLLKMYQPLEVEALTSSSLSSMSAGIWASGTLFPLPLLGHITEVRECTLLPTPAATQTIFQEGLHSFNGMYWIKPSGIKNQTDLYLTILGQSLEEGSIIGRQNIGHINPPDVEWLMGYPEDWTKID